MKKVTSSVLAGTLTAALAATFAQPAGAAMRADAPSQADGQATAASHRPDNRPGPLTKKQDKLRAAAVEALVDGRKRSHVQEGGGSTVKLAEDKYVEFPRERSDTILTMLSEFSDQTHNGIPEPDRSQDNSTTWSPDYNVAHYQEMFNGDGESMKDYYEQTSSGRYSVSNGVEDWVQVPGTAASYGANPHEDEGGAWDFINDTGDSWYADKLKELGSAAAVDQYLAQFDQWDRYDYDEDGDFNEPDGYIDHFQAIHAGEGEEAGASADAIWSHRWYVNGTDYGVTGPTVNDTQVKFGGAQIGDSKYFIGDYTVEPENGGLGVFAHEFGHDLGLPDFYDTAGGDNSTSFWTLMSSGSWLSHGADTDGDGPDQGDDGIGTTPGGMGPDEKLFLEWLKYDTVDPGDSKEVTLGGAAHTRDGAVQAAMVNLPDKSTTTHYTTPYSGEHAWWSGRGDNLNNTLTREVPAASRVTVTSRAWYEIEQNYDYLYGEFSVDGGTNWQPAGDPITGSVKSWRSLRFSYNPAGKPSLFRFRYATDGGVNEAGAFLDDITVKADRTTVSDGAEDGDNGWDVEGWKASTGTETVKSAQYYLMENRTYEGYDATLQEGPYNFSEAVERPNWVEFFPFQNGMLVWYADKAYADNNTSEHPGHGQALPVDARPKPFYYNDGTMPSNRRQAFDATFGLEKTDEFCLHKQAMAGKNKKAHMVEYQACPPVSDGVATFDDSEEDTYWSAANPWGSTKVAGVGVKATVISQNADNLVVRVVNP